MGYVGIPCAALLADVPGHTVTGIQRRSKRSGWKIDCLNSGRSPFEGDEPGLAELIHRVAVDKETFRVTDDYAVCQDADVILIDVQTPTDGNHVPRYESLKEVTEQVGRHLQPDTLVIIESTVAPGTTEHVVKPILERESGLSAGQGEKETRGGGEGEQEGGNSKSAIRNLQFYLAFSYERVMPGKLLQYITDFPRVVGGVDEQSTRRAVALYETIVKKEVSGTDVLTAEMAKVIENAYRDVNIAFANEMALACERMGVDAFRIRELINARPDRNVHTPGAGVGGHCLPKDSWLLKYGVETYGRQGEGETRGQGDNLEIRNLSRVHPEPSRATLSRDLQFELQLIPLAREINDAMPAHMLSLIEDALDEAGQELEGAKVALLGVAYLENADDTRNTPAADLAVLLQDRGADVVAHDPHVRQADWQRALVSKPVPSGAEGSPIRNPKSVVPLTKDLDAVLSDADCAAIVTRHREYADLTPEMLSESMRTPVVVDGRNVFGSVNGIDSGVVFRGVGKPYA